MKLENKKLYDVLNVGMNIYYKQFKKPNLIIGTYEFTEEEKMYLSLYLGVLHSKNIISNLYKEQNIDETKEYVLKDNDNKLITFLNMYEESFSVILGDKNFESLEDYFKFLIEQRAVKVYNDFIGIKVKYEKDVPKIKVKA